MTAGDPLEGLREALRLSPENVPLRQHFAESLLGLGRFEEAEAELRRALALSPDNPALKLGLANAFRLEGKSSEALVVVEEIQSRFDLAEKEVRQALLQDPNDPVAHGLLAMCLSERKQLAGAMEEARSAVGAAPDNPFTHFAMAHVLYDRDRLDEAARAVNEAIRLDNEKAAYFALLAAIRIDQRKWQEGLAAAESGLAIDPGHGGCANLRGIALIQLGRRAEAGAAVEGVLEQDPNDALAHSTRGWTLLEGGDRARALEHFKEALRIEPELEPARAGIVEALKAKNIVYAILLRYFLWMSRLGTGAQWGLIIGGVIAVRVLRRFARDEPAMAPWIWPILILYFVFVVLTWIADPLFNLFLRLDPLGRHALSREQVAAANWVGGTLLAAAAAAIAALVLGKPEALLPAAGLGLLSMPISGVLRCAPGWPRTAMAILTAGLGLSCLAALALYIAGPSGDPDAIATARGARRRESRGHPALDVGRRRARHGAAEEVTEDGDGS